MRFLKDLIARKKADLEETWDEEEFEAEDVAEWDDAPDPNAIFADAEAESLPLPEEDEDAAAAADEDWKTRNDTRAIARQIATTEMRDLLNRVAVTSSDVAAEPRPAPALESPPTPIPGLPTEKRRAAKIWELDDEQTESQSMEMGAPRRADPALRAVPPADPAPSPAAAPAQGDAGRASGRQKTRMLGFQTPAQEDVFDAPRAEPASGSTMYPTGWIVIVSGPGRGHSFTLGNGVSQIGRGEDQAVRLDFGDMTISRNNHAAIAFDAETGKFYLGHGGKSNLVRLNGRPVLSTEELSSYDAIRLGETELRFVGFCGEEFAWNEEPGIGQDAATA